MSNRDGLKEQLKDMFYATSRAGVWDYMENNGDDSLVDFIYEHTAEAVRQARIDELNNVYIFTTDDGSTERAISERIARLEEELNNE